MGRSTTIGIKCKPITILGFFFVSTFILDANPRAQKSNDKVPGPGQYNMTDRYLRNSPNYTIPPTPKANGKHLSRNRSNMTPGAGDYSPNSNKKHWPKYTMASRSPTPDKSKRKSFIPGPGDYDLDKDFNRTSNSRGYS